MTIYFKDTYYEFKKNGGIRSDFILFAKFALFWNILLYKKTFVVHIIVVFFPNGEMIKGNDNKWYIFDITVVSARL